MKRSIYPFGVLALTELIAWFPAVIGQLVMMWVISKATVIFSNVPGPKKPLYFGSVKCKGIIGLIPGIGDLALGISAMSHENSVYMSI